MSEWQEVGRIGVDAGCIMISDPCYSATPDCNSHPAKTWQEFCELLDKGEFYKNGFQQLNYKGGHSGLGVVVESGYGDGCYPVFVKKNKEGRVIEAKVVFDDINEEENYEEDNDPYGRDEI